MKNIIACPCCSNRLLHHFSNHREYWFCRHCWQEMPNIDIIEYRQDREYTLTMPIKMNSSRQPLLTV